MMMNLKFRPAAFNLAAQALTRYLTKLADYGAILIFLWGLCLWVIQRRFVSKLSRVRDRLEKSCTREFIPSTIPVPNTCPPVPAMQSCPRHSRPRLIYALLSNINLFGITLEHCKIQSLSNLPDGALTPLPLHVQFSLLGSYEATALWALSVQSQPHLFVQWSQISLVPLDNDQIRFSGILLARPQPDLPLEIQDPRSSQSAPTLRNT